MRFGAQNFGIYGVSARNKVIEPMQTFCGEGNQSFAILCERLLWTAPNRMLVNDAKGMISTIITIKGVWIDYRCCILCVKKCT